MGLRDRLKRFQRASDSDMMTLQCPECGEEFLVHGDAPLKYIVHEWRKGVGKEGYRKTPEDMLRAFEHEHHPGAFIEKRSGLPFLSKPVSGMNLGAQTGESAHDA